MTTVHISQLTYRGLPEEPFVFSAEAAARAWFRDQCDGYDIRYDREGDEASPDRLYEYGYGADNPGADGMEIRCWTMTLDDPTPWWQREDQRKRDHAGA